MITHRGRASRREGKRERAQAARSYRPYWEFYLWYLSHPAEVHQTNQQGAGWPHTRTHTHIHKKHTCTHTHIQTHMPRHRPPPGLTFAAKCCNGWLFMLRRLVMGRVQQVAALYCLSDRSSGIITSWAHPTLLSTAPPYICLSVVLFLGTHPLSLPPRCSLCCEMPPDCSSLSHFPPTDVHQPSGYL